MPYEFLYLFGLPIHRYQTTTVLISFSITIRERIPKAIGIINKFRVNRHTITRNTHNFMLLISFRQLIICLLLSVRQQSTDNQRYTHYYLVHLNPLFAIHHLLLSSHLLTNTSQNDTTIYAQRKPLPFPRNHAHYPVTRSSRNSSLP